MDFQMINDNSVACVHDWNAEFSDGHKASVVESEKDFFSMQILGRYSALSFGDLLQIMSEHPDISSMVETAEKLGLLFKFIIV